METQELSVNEVEPVDRKPEPETQTMAIIERAVERGTSPDELSKLLDLHDRVESKRAETAYNVAMQACQQEMPVIATNAVNPETKKRYANLEAVMKLVRPIYTRHGFAVSYGSGKSDLPNHILVTLDCSHVGGHTVRRELNCPYDTTGPKGGATKTAIQGMGSSVSYGRRYLLLMHFNITVSDEDDDGNAGKEVPRVDAQQIAALREWMDQLTEQEQDKFLDYMQVDAVAFIPAPDYKKALSALMAKVESKRR